MNALRNKVQLIGHLGMDPEVKTLESGRKMAKFSLATSETYKNAEGQRVTDTQWHNLIVWGALTSVPEKFLQKGSQVAVEGRLTHRSFEDKEGNTRYFTEIIVNDILMLDKKEK